MLGDEVGCGEPPEGLSQAPEPGVGVGGHLEQIPELPHQVHSFVQSIEKGVAASKDSPPNHDPSWDSSCTGWMEWIRNMDAIHEIRRSRFSGDHSTIQIHERPSQPNEVPIHLASEVGFHDEKKECLATVVGVHLREIRGSHICIAG